MTTVMTVADLAGLTGIDPLDHLDCGTVIPVHDEPQSQGDVRFRRLDSAPGVTVRPGAAWRQVPPAGLTVVDGGDGGHAHVLTPVLGAAAPLEYTSDVADVEGLAVGVIRAAEPCYVFHAEHGGLGLAPGLRVVRRQREQSDRERLVAD